MIRENVYAHRKRLDFIIESIKGYCFSNNRSQDSIRILDFGCGTGYMITIPLAACGYNIIGIDKNNESIEIAKKINNYQKASFITGDIEKLKTAPFFDVIICSEVLEHLKYPEELLKTFHSLIHNEGILFLTVPNGYSWFELEQYIWSKLNISNVIKKLEKYESYIKKKIFWINIEELVSEFPSTLDPTPHFQRFTLKRLRRLFLDNGFELAAFKKASIFSGKISDFFFRGFDSLLKLNNLLANTLPSFCSSGWYFVLKKRIFKEAIDGRV